MKGDITLIGLLNYRGTLPDKPKCSVIRPSDGLLLAVAMKNAVERVNRDTNILPNIKIGLKIFDVCEQGQLQDIVLKMLWTSNISGVIGPTNCEDTSTVGVVMSIYHIPMITFNEIPLRIDYKKFFEIQYWAVPTIVHSVHALMDFIVHMNWNFVGLYFQNNEYGYAVRRTIHLHSHVSPICSSNVVIKDVGTSEREYSLSFFQHFIMEDQRAKVIVLLLEEAEIAKFLRGLRLLHKDTVKQYIFLSLSTWGTKQLPVLGNEEYAHGMITFQPIYKMEKTFQDFFHSREFRREPLVQNYTRSLCYEMKRPGTRCINQKDFEKTFGNITHSKASAIINSVYAFATTFHYLDSKNLSQYIQNERRDTNFLMKNLTIFGDDNKLHPFRKDLFAFQENRRIKPNIGIYNFQKFSDGEYGYKKIGDWSYDPMLTKSYTNNSKYFGELNLLNRTEIQWPSPGGKPPVSTCSTHCSKNQVKILTPRFEECCNTCHTCETTEIIFNNTCKPCQQDQRPDTNLSSCVKLPHRMTHVNSVVKVVTITCSCIGIFASILVFSLFVYFRNERIVKASSKELSGFILVGTLMMCLVPMLTFYRVSDIVCFLERLLLYIGFTFVYAPLFLKTNRVYRIFQAAQSSAIPPKIVSPLSQVLITLVFCTVQILLSVPRINLMKIGYLYPDHKNYVEIYCKDDFLLFCINLGYVLVLMGATTFYAFKTRHFPKNYNESKYIGFAMYITCFDSAVGLVAYFLLVDIGTKIIVLSWACLICAYVVLICLFGQKVVFLYKTQRVKKQKNESDLTKSHETSLGMTETTSISTDSPRLWYLRRLSNLSFLKTSPNIKKKENNSRKEVSQHPTNVDSKI